ncbi:MAG: hypothetical protein PHF00_05910 [Elusimicrobia bacterium]|nr:hypothetical protein [Elusimicrobiota bacterium]
MIRGLLRLAPALLLGGCVSVPRPQHRTSPDLAVVVGQMRFEKIVRPFPDHDALSLRLAPLDAAGGIDEDRPLLSAYAQDGLVYFFNVPAGRYVLLGGSYLAHGLRYAFRLRGDAIRQTELKVAPGEAAFLGEVTVQRRFQGWDVFALNALKSAARLLPPWRALTTEVDAYFKFVDRGPFTEAQVLDLARRHLAGTLWVAGVEARLSALGGPPIEPILIGGWRKKPKPYEVEPRFRWLDVLDWGPPRRVQDGLEWRAPKDRARIVVLFRSADRPDFQPLDGFLRELKTLGSPEDEHAFADVSISTWTGRALRYTKYVYPEPYLTGSVQQVFLTEVSVFPAYGGYYAIYYRARRGDFDRWRGRYLDFRRRLELTPPPKPAPEADEFE